MRFIPPSTLAGAAIVLLIGGCSNEYAATLATATFSKLRVTLWSRVDGFTAGVFLTPKGGPPCPTFSDAVLKARFGSEALTPAFSNGERIGGYVPAHSSNYSLLGQNSVAASCADVAWNSGSKVLDEPDASAVTISDGTTSIVIGLAHATSERLVSVDGRDGGYHRGDPVIVRWTPADDDLVNPVVTLHTDNGQWSVQGDEIAHPDAGLLQFAVPVGPTDNGGTVTLTVGITNNPRITSCEGVDSCLLMPDETGHPDRLSIPFEYQ